MRPSTTTIRISKEYLHFSSAHFTIFSATEREDLHGHTFYVTANIDCSVGDDGLAFDYNLVKDTLKRLCDQLDEKVLLPEDSPYLQLTQQEGYLIATFADERIPFLPRDALTLPVRNITVEELAPWFLQEFISDPNIRDQDLQRICLGVSSGPGQWAESTWTKAQATHT